MSSTRRVRAKANTPSLNPFRRSISTRVSDGPISAGESSGIIPSAPLDKNTSTHQDLGLVMGMRPNRSHTAPCGQWARHHPRLRNSAHSLTLPIPLTNVISRRLSAGARSGRHLRVPPPRVYTIVRRRRWGFSSRRARDRRPGCFHCGPSILRQPRRVHDSPCTFTSHVLDSDRS